MTRQLRLHKTDARSDVLEINVLEESGYGGNGYLYEITSYGPRDRSTPPAVRLTIPFQNGPIAEAGVNGITQEALLAIVADRLECFQDGPYSCRENAIALTKIQEALHWLHHRTRERVARGVEGTSTP